MKYFQHNSEDNAPKLYNTIEVELYHALKPNMNLNITPSVSNVILWKTYWKLYSFNFESSVKIYGEAW